MAGLHKALHLYMFISFLCSAGVAKREEEEEEVGSQIRLDKEKGQQAKDGAPLDAAPESLMDAAEKVQTQEGNNETKKGCDKGAEQFCYAWIRALTGSQDTYKAVVDKWSEKGCQKSDAVKLCEMDWCQKDDDTCKILQEMVNGEHWAEPENKLFLATKCTYNAMHAKCKVAKPTHWPCAVTPLCEGAKTGGYFDKMTKKLPGFLIGEFKDHGSYYEDCKPTLSLDNDGKNSCEGPCITKVREFKRNCKGKDECYKGEYYKIEEEGKQKRYLTKQEICDDWRKIVNAGDPTDKLNAMFNDWGTACHAEDLYTLCPNVQA